ncbi:ERV/ALR sulfhydryl oxidase domain-containing protein [Polychytrium aggregatum]|uniref:ERV/ALR sulfhydryl oxidase domain-containing protein n=1 Tax=Polychytrium aggregatum TaxID=110093 RepID=UPI0022FE926B|nr:ERV/ALR sulfhydryl oxidase domain-containing protein [Polychytrium aggregatum]KAI9199443.1 ERV/ALR sulfhydryl oxidase domain-containing protein [Polychytrium aggregatum]
MDPIMSKMGNETLKAELGRSSWRLIHTMVGKFPVTPTDDEKESLLDFIYLFAKLYPCGDCARHFQKILRANPPDVSSRDAASQWACKVHNLVNKRLGKPQFDCSTVAEIWKCGCAEEDGANSTSTATSTSNSMSTSLPAASAHSTTLVL